MFGADPLDLHTSRLGVGRQHERGQPAVGKSTDPPQLAGRDAAEPHVHPLRRRLDDDTVVVEPGPIVTERLGGPALPHDLECLVEDRCTLAAFDTECLLLDRIDGAEPERGEQSTARHRGERRQFLREHHGIAPGRTMTDIPNFSLVVRPAP